MFNRILLIPGRGGTESAAVRRAQALAESFTAEIQVFDPVYEPLLEGYYGHNEIYEPLRRRLVEERRETAERIAEALGKGGRRASADAVWDHPIEQAIARRANARDVDVIVTEPLAGHAGAMSHADWRLVAMSPVPVLVVRSDARTAYRKIVAAVDPIHAHAKPADLDATILAQAQALQARFGVELEVVHCFVPLTRLAAAGADAGDLPLDDAERALEEARRHEVERLVAGAGLPVSSIRLEAGRPEDVLERMLEGGEADLVVMGALSRGRLRDLVIGSTAERVLRGGKGDVLAVRPTTLESTG